MASIGSASSSSEPWSENEHPLHPQTLFVNDYDTIFADVDDGPVSWHVKSKLAVNRRLDKKRRLTSRKQLEQQIT